MVKEEKLLIFLLVGIQILLLFYFDDVILFWDTVQFAGKQASHFYYNGYVDGLILPQKIDSGHPPFFAIYLSSLWKVMGRNLAVTHWAMLPFLIGISYQSVRLSYFLMPRKYWLFPLMLLVCPYYLGQSILVSPDLVLVLGFLISLKAILEKRSIPLAIGILLMSMISTRGAAISGILFIYDFYINHWKGWRNLSLKSISGSYPYLLGGITFVAYNIYHFNKTSWIGYHEASSWAPSFEWISWQKAPWYLIKYFWTFMDYGMITCGFLILYKVRSLFIMKGRLIWLLMALVVILGLITIPYVGLLNHRYFLPSVIVLLILTSQVLYALNRKWLTGLFILVIMGGNFWIYPDNISQGWDSTFAHTSFYSLENNFKDYRVKNGISISEIGTAFPIRTPRKYLELTEENIGYHEYDLNTDRYILYSNVMNDFSDRHRNILQKDWDVVYNEEARGITMILYTRNKNE